MPEIYKNFIDGEWVNSLTGDTFENRNPAKKTEIVGIFQKSCIDDVNNAVNAAVKSSDAWKAVPPPERAKILYKVAKILEDQKESLANDMTREMGKVLKETRGDVQEAIDMAYYIAGEGRRLFGDTTTSELPDKFCMSVRMPIGVVAAITPWNFPMAIPSWKLLPAILAGNTVVIKPATDTPLSSINFVKAFESAGLPKGVLNIITGTGGAVGMPMVQHKDVQIVSFTGSTDTGRTIAQECGKNLKRYSLEMGGKNAIIVMDDADLDLAVEGAVWGAFGTTGQRCTATSRLIVHEKVMKEFIGKLLKQTEALKLGDGLLDTTDVGPVINESQLNKIDEYVEIGKKEGANLLTGGTIYTEGDCKNGFFYTPTIFTEVDRNMRIATEEIFGPVLSIISCSNFKEAIEIANGTIYGLSSAIYTQDVNRAFKAIKSLDAGITYINASTIGAEVHLPFGGTKGTGNGHREAGNAVWDIFTEWKSVYVDYSGKLQKAQIDNN